MERTTDEDSNALISCTNHACRSNGGITKREPGTLIDWVMVGLVALIGVLALLRALNKL